MSESKSSSSAADHATAAPSRAPGGYAQRPQLGRHVSAPGTRPGLRGLQPSAYPSLPASRPFYRQGGAAAGSIDAFAGPTYRGIPLGAVQAQQQTNAQGPLRSAARPPVYRSLSASGAAGAVAAPYSAAPVYRSLGVQHMPPMRHHLAPEHDYGALPPKHHVGQSPLGVRTTASVALKSASYANSDVIVLPPKPLPPFFLERTHFYSRCAPTELVAAVENAVQTSGVVDVVFDRQKCKWKIDLYVNNHQLKIFGRLYQVTPDISVVEFNRRKGESLVFCSWYRDLCHALHEGNAICGKDGGASPMVTTNSKPKRGVRGVQACPAVNADCLGPLLEMAKTSFIETQAEAAREVANLSTRRENRRVIVTAGFLEPLVQLLQSHNGDVHRCAAVAVGNIAEGANTSADVKAGLNTQSSKILDNLCDLLKKEVGVDCDLQAHRCAARALENLVQHCGIALAPQHQTFLRQCHASCSDDRLQAHLDRMLQLVA